MPSTPTPPPPGDASRLVVRDLACRRGERLVFSGVSLTVDAGEIVWATAPNGRGKTSLLRLLAGLGRPEAGSIAWRATPRPVFVGHGNALKDDLTVDESLAYACRLHGLPATAADRARAIVRIGLAGRRRAPIRTLSQGLRRRVALARLCLSPASDVWLLDEPFDALDAEGTATVAALFGEHAGSGGAVLFTSHVAPAAAGVRFRTWPLEGDAA